MLSKIIRFIVCLLFILSPAACGRSATDANSQPGKTPLVVFAAGSLIIPFAELEKAFEAENPDIDVQAEYHGSIQVMRHVSELHEEIDVVATADTSLIPMLMYSSTDPGSGEAYADWYIRFASNRMAIAYRPQSKHAAEIHAENWPEILARPEVKLGLSDPRFDALGYRMLMAFALEENRRGQYNLFEPVFKNQFSFPVTIFRDENLTTVTVPEVLETKPGSHILMRGGSIMLIALLESGDVDYAFEYESVIRQHGLEMLSLPEAVNMGEDQFASRYQAVQVNLDFQRFATVKPQFRGEQIGYGITIPSNAPHPDEAARFISFLLSPQGRAIMEASHHPLFDLPTADGHANMPESLQELCTPMDAP